MATKLSFNSCISNCKSLACIGCPEKDPTLEFQALSSRTRSVVVIFRLQG